MWEEILKAIPVFLGSMLKFILGPSIGYGARLHPLTTVIATIGGMMASVFSFTYFGNWIKTKVLPRFFPRRKRFSARNRKFVRIWKKYGLTGIAALTPLLLTPIGGTIIALSFGTPKEKIILFMFISAVGWAVVITGAIYFFGHQILHALPDFVK